MSFFRRKDPNQIPLPPSRASPSPQPNVLRRDPPGQGPPSYRSNVSSSSVNQGSYGQTNYGQTPMYQQSNAYNSSYGDQKAPTYDDRDQPPPRDGGRYGGDVRGGYGDDSGGYHTRNTAPIGDPYSRGFRNVDADRSELFAGYNAERAAAASGGRNRFDDRPTGPGRSGWQDREPQTQEEMEEDVEAIKKDIRGVKNDSLSSTRNALRLAREAEETARATLSKLGDQSEKLANSERLLDQSKGHTARAEDRTSEIKQLNRSIFRPVIVFNKEGKRQREDQRLADRHAAERDERERGMREVRDSQNRIGRATTLDEEQDTYGMDNDADAGLRYGRRGLTQTQQDARKAGRSRFQFDATGSDDELEDELDDNLDEIHDVTKRLKALATAQGEELGHQNTRLTRMNDNASKLDDRLQRATNNLKRL